MAGLPDLDLTVSSGHGSSPDFTVFMGCQMDEESTCGYWAVAQLLMLRRNGAREVMARSTPAGVKKIVKACPAAFLDVHRRLASVIVRYAPEVVDKVGMDEGATFCSDVSMLAEAFGVEAAAVCQVPDYCLRHGCTGLPERLQGLQEWVVLAEKHWYAALTLSTPGGRVEKVVALDSLTPDNTRTGDWDRCAALRAILKRLYSRGRRTEAKT